MNVRHHSHKLPFLKVALLVAVVAAIAGIALARRSIFPSMVVASALVNAAKSEAVTPVAAQRPRPIADIESELVTITSHGFEPRQITRPQGRFLLLIDNRSGLATVAPRLTPVGGLRLLNLTIPREEPNWNDVLDLQAGVYLLTEANHPAWLCRLTITPQ